MEKTDYINMRGDVDIVVYDSHGNIDREYKYNNLIVTTGKNFVANQLAKPLQLKGNQAITVGTVYYYDGYLYTCTVAGTTSSSGITSSLTTAIDGTTTTAVGSVATVKCIGNMNTDGIAISHMAIGTGTTPPVASNTSLEHQLSDRSSTSLAHVDGTNYVSVTSYFSGSTYASASVTEAGLFTASTGGKLICRTSFGSFSIGSSETIGITWKITLE